MARPSSSSKAPAKLRRRRPAIIEDANAVEGVVVGAFRLGNALGSRIDKFFQPYGITLLQFHVLRILYVRDPEGAGLPSGMIGARLLTRVPDVPRMMDRLVKAGLIERAASAEDRRVVLIRLTQKGVDLMEEVVPLLLEHNRGLFPHMSNAELAQLAEGLRRALDGPLSARDDE